ncbi:MAG: tetratricopeptide repeat protein [Bacteroidota bacterium]
MSRFEQLLDFHRQDPDDAFVRYALAQEYLRLGETEQALAYFEGLVADQPDYVGTYYHLGKLYEDLHRKDDAVRTYQAGIGVAASDPHARAELQSALLEAQGIGFD